MSIIEPAGDVFTTPYVVEPDDLDELGHANNVSYLRWLQMVTARHNAAYGLDQNYLLASKTVFVVMEYDLKYERPCKLGENLTLSTRVSRYNPFFHIRDYKILNDEGATIFRAVGKWVSVALDTGKLSRMPSEHFGRLTAMANPTPKLQDNRGQI